MKIKLLRAGSSLIQAAWTLLMIATFAFVFGVMFSKGQFDYKAYKCAPHNHKHENGMKSVGHKHRRHHKRTK